MADNQLDRLIASFDDFRERLTRIEEGIKPINDIKRDVDSLKITVSEVMASTKSSHKRIDDVEDEFSAYATKIEHDSHNKRIEKLEKLVYWVGTTIIGAVILAALGVILI
jgi:predicted  nucleic acid-binding Zn-ribbon protein